MKKHLHMMILGLIMLIVLGIAIMAQSKGKEGIGGQILLAVNQTAVPEEEFEMFLQDQKALIVNEFVKEYEVEYGSAFWTTSYEGQIPLEKAKQNALEELIKVKIEQQIAKEMGLIKDNQFKTIKELIKKDKSIYGADNLDFFQQYRVYHSKLVLEVEEKHKLGQTEVSEEALRARYEEDKDILFDTPDDIEAIILEVEFVGNQESQTIMESITREIIEGIEVGELQQKYKEVCEITPQLKNYGLAEGKDENMSEQELLLKEAAYELEVGQMSEPILEGDNYLLVICMDRKENGVADFGDVKIVLEDMVKEEVFNQYIKMRIDEAIVEINEVLYEKIQMK